MTYTTQPGTVPHRALEFLKSKPPGFSIATAPFAEAIDVDVGSLSASLATPRKHGLIASERSTKGMFLVWSLGNGESALPQDSEPDELDPCREKIEMPVRAWASVPVFGIFSDGRMTIEADGKHINLQADAVKKLRSFLLEHNSHA